MNWGLKIVFGLASFMLFIIGSSLYMVFKDSDSLVDENYYENSLSFDEVIISKQNLLNDDAKPALSFRNDTLFVNFKTNNNVGIISFKRPSDGKLDRKKEFKSSHHNFELPIHGIEKGSWVVDIIWQHADKNYNYSQSLFIP